ncbi:hypothetical protein BKG82_27805 [Mycobacteroides chelonae]|uniref:Uncharacterized protein n=1 Tax=Mycobacteroides chelonae TaxID=1774 RepID=A0A1S1LLD8_MYCCH|nr:hypothetical protein BKG82_27805 [Mycobacteroides chelonae]
MEFYDLGQRLYSASIGRPVLRVASALFTLTASAVFVQTSVDEDIISAQIATGSASPVEASGADILDALAGAGAHFRSGSMAQLVVADYASLRALVQVARQHPMHEAAAVTGWWGDRTGYPGTSAVIDLMTHSRQRYITGAAPDSERCQQHWRDSFALPAGTEGMLQWATRLSCGDRMPVLTPIWDDDQRSFAVAAKNFGAGRDWSGSDSAPDAAVRLRQRCDTADAWQAALLSDRLWRHRATHTGHVCGGEVIDTGRTGFSIACERMDSRLKAGTAVCGWSGGVDSYDRATTFHGEIAEADASGGALTLTVRGVRAEQRPAVGLWVTVMPAMPDDRRVRSGQYKYGQKQFSPESWLASGRKPGLTRRDVPLDVLIAAAEREAE